jgi:hypothetical protein
MGRYMPVQHSGTFCSWISYRHLSIYNTYPFIFFHFSDFIFLFRRSQWPRSLTRRYAAAWLQGSRVRIPLGAWMFVSCAYVLLPCVGRGLCDGLITCPEESYRVSNCVCDHTNPERGPMFQVGNDRKMMNDILVSLSRSKPALLNFHFQQGLQLPQSTVWRYCN